MNNKGKIDDLVERMYDYLLYKPKLARSTADVVATVIGRDIVDCDLMEIHEALMDYIKKIGTCCVDKGQYTFVDDEKPYNTPWKLMPRYEFGLRAWGKLLCICMGGSSVDRELKRYANEIVAITECGYNISFDRQIPMATTLRMLDEAERQKCRLKVVPDKEFLSGEALLEYQNAFPEDFTAGSRNNQCDGWSYHFELDRYHPGVLV